MKNHENAFIQQQQENNTIYNITTQNKDSGCEHFPLNQSK